MNPLSFSPRGLPSDLSVDRRAFLKSVAASAFAGTIADPVLQAAAKVRSETLVAQLYRSLDAQQRASICRAFEDPLRSKVNNNWMIGKSQKEVLNKDQQDLVRQIFLGLHSPEYAPRVMEQVVHDSEGDGFDGGTSVMLFGEPDSGKFEFVLTGRHCTRRCDGDSVAGAAFGGPIFYGHAAKGFREGPEHAGNIYWYQALRANEVFRMLDGKQQELALVETVRAEKETQTVALSGSKEGLPGIPVAGLSADQKGLVRKVLQDVLAPFREEDAQESLRLIEPQFDALHLAFCKNMDLGGDRVWDVWQIQGPDMLWLFRGAPHVHVWVHVREASKKIG